MLLTIMAALGQMEHEINRERVVNSINRRREADQDLGSRPRLITDSQIRNAHRLIDGEETATTVPATLECLEQRSIAERGHWTSPECHLRRPNVPV
jgi:DNA invertase Pin-like site-specific DNA recombinase